MLSPAQIIIEESTTPIIVTKNFEAVILIPVDGFVGIVSATAGMC